MPSSPSPLPAPPRRVLIIKPSAIGDVVHALPVLNLIRRGWPDAHVSWLVSPACAGLLDGHPQLDEVIRFERRRFGRAWRSPSAAAELAAFHRDLHGRGFDLVDRPSGPVPQRLAVVQHRGRRAGGHDGRPRVQRAVRHASGAGRPPHPAGDRPLPGRGRVAGARPVTGASTCSRPTTPTGPTSPPCCRTRGRSPCSCRRRTGRPSNGRLDRYAETGPSRCGTASASPPSSPAGPRRPTLDGTRGDQPGRPDDVAAVGRAARTGGGGDCAGHRADAHRGGARPPAWSRSTYPAPTDPRPAPARTAGPTPSSGSTCRAPRA